jgi:hypothetical protein
MAFGFFVVRVLCERQKTIKKECKALSRAVWLRAIEAGVTAYLLYNGSATYVYQRA